MTAWRYVLMSKRNIVLLCILIFSKCFQLFNCVSKACLFELIPAPTSLWASTLYELFRLCYSSYYLSLCTYYSTIYNIVEVEVEVLISVKVCLLQTSLELSIFIILAQIFTTFSPVSQHSLSILHETVELKIIPIVWLWACEPFFHGRRLCKWKCYYSRLSQAPL